MKKIEFLHLSDPHLLQSFEGHKLWEGISKSGINPGNNFANALDYLNQHYKHLDFIIITGDYVYDTKEEHYRYVKSILDEKIKVPILYAMGNHDKIELFSKVFLGEEIPWPYCWEKHINGFQILALDTCDRKSSMGEIGQKQMAWLKTKLENPGEHGTIIMMHHPPGLGVSKGHLKDEKEFYHCVKNSSVRAVFAGHFHRSFTYMLGNIPVFVSDSICLGFNAYGSYADITDRQGYNHCIMNEKEIILENHVLNTGKNILFKLPTA